jgi:hypothetical protein
MVGRCRDPVLPIQPQAFYRPRAALALEDPIHVGSAHDAGADSALRVVDHKILDIILRSADRVEILDRIVEERVRGLFYGAPASFFVKPASKMEFGDTFSREFAQALQRYVEICARRNCIVHNKARSDRKYYREIGRADDGNLGKKLSFTGEYLRESMNTLRGMAAIACESVCINIYNSRPPAGAIVRRRTKAFRVQEGT